jgi:hypothetical protein
MELFNINIYELVAVLVLIYEALSRIIPTSKEWNLIGRILDVLSKISKALDRKKK